LGGLVVAGLVYVVVAAIIKAFGTKWLYRILPPALVGAVVIIIGLGLAGVAIKMSLFPFASPDLGLDWNLVAVASITLAACIAFSSYFKGFLGTIPILMGIVVGYIAAIPFGLVNFKPVLDAAWIGLPTLTIAKFEPSAIMLIAPVALVVIVEHIGHLLVINEITGKDFNPLLPQSLAGDGLATSLSAMVGGTPSTTYAENIGVMAVTRIYAVQLFWYAGAFAFVIGGFVPKLGALIGSIPTPVMGGVSILLFGLIAASGLRMLVDSGIDYSHSRNLILSSVVLVLGIGMEVGEIKIPIGEYTVPGMALATVVGVILNLILPAESKGLAIDSPDFGGEIQAEAATESQTTA
jgi:uracil permease